MRGILSLGAIGLMTSASVMVAAPTNAGAVTPIDFVSQQMSQFPQSVVGTPTMAEGDEIAASDETIEAGATDAVSEPAGEPVTTVQTQTTVNSRQSLADSLRNSLISGPSTNDATAETGDAIEEQTSELAVEPAGGSVNTAGETAEGEETAAVQSAESPTTGSTSSAASVGGVDLAGMLDARLGDLVTGDDSEPGFDAATAGNTTEFQSPEGVGGGGQAPGVRGSDLFAAASNDVSSPTNGNLGFNALDDDIEAEDSLTSDAAGTSDAAAGETTEAAGGGSGGADASGDATTAGDAAAAGETADTGVETGDAAAAADGVPSTGETAAADTQAGGISTANALLRERLQEIVTGANEAAAAETDAVAGEETVDTQAGEPSDAQTADAGDGNADAAAAADGVPASGETAAADTAAADTQADGISTANAFLQERLREIVTGANEAAATESDSTASDEAAGAAGETTDAESTEADAGTDAAPAAADGVPAAGDTTAAADDAAADVQVSGISTANSVLRERLQEIVTGANEAAAADSGAATGDETVGGAGDVTETASGESAPADDAAPTDFEPRTFSTADQLADAQLQEIVTGGADTTDAGTPVQDTGLPEIMNGNGGSADNLNQASSPNSVGDDSVTPAPEPATWIMMILGFWIAAWRLRRMKAGVKGPVPA